MKARSGSTGGGSAMGRKSSKASAINEKMYKSAKASEKRRTQTRVMGSKRGK